MLTVTIFGPGEEGLGSWYPEDDQVQVPRKGDILWLETDELKHSRWRVVNVQWAFRNRTSNWKRCGKWLRFFKRKCVSFKKSSAYCNR